MNSKLEKVPVPVFHFKRPFHQTLYCCKNEKRTRYSPPLCIMDNDVFGKLGLRVRVRVRSIIKKTISLINRVRGPYCNFAARILNEVS